MSIMLSLIGEQPIPNLLPIRYFDPEENLLVHTNLDASQKAAKRLGQLARGCQPILLKEAYQVPAILNALHNAIAPYQDAVINLTGGTKMMSLAAFELARQRNLSCIYYQTEGPRGRDQKSILYQYGFDQTGNLILEQRIELPVLLTLDDYLKAHLDGYEIAGFSRTSGSVLEKAVAEALKASVDEQMTGVKPMGAKEQAEIDLFIRCGNHVAVLEVKTGGEGSGKHAVDQLTTIAAREYLGTYAARFLVTQSSPEDRYKAIAAALRVRVIELKEYHSGKPLSQSDKRTLLEAVSSQLPMHINSMQGVRPK